MSHPNKVRGYKWEVLVLEMLRAVWPGARRTGSARQAYADFEVIEEPCPFLMEAKDEKTITLSKYLDQVAVSNGKLMDMGEEERWPVVFVKRRQRAAEKGYAVMEIETFLQIAQTMKDLEAEAK